MRMALAVASFRNAAVSAGFAARMAGKPLDDRAGRLEARSHGLALIGSAAVIGLAKTEGLIPAARPLFGTDDRVRLLHRIRDCLVRIGRRRRIALMK